VKYLRIKLIQISINFVENVKRIFNYPKIKDFAKLITVKSSNKIEVTVKLVLKIMLIWYKKIDLYVKEEIFLIVQLIFVKMVVANKNV